MKQEYIECGKIVAVHGLKGDVRVYPIADSPDFLVGRTTLYMGGDHEPVTVERASVHKNVVLMKLAGYGSVEAAYPLRGRKLYVKRGDIQLPEGDFFVADLLGARCVNADTKRDYGVVADVLKTGANDVYVVHDDTGVERLVPAIKEVVVSVDLDAGLVTIRPLKGLFDDED